ncbi:hypothetical protein OD91_1552 [Lutibacter sp. Hel_I_33_5]|uniref:DUF6427 family protein n=1 Tax=Lutibacter sp. Hel_I_33_5 TaxID=1566289 RepID=UPI0011ADBCD2|nr:DUF6427 family protein [Lutibacter sp. Hel_I_33_5]TVZ56270.1 hypothetical protein OD91_1552 [Lutibacter sp. Hel_I_33_5]
MLANFFENSKPINFILIAGLFILYFFASLINDFATFYLLSLGGCFLLLIGQFFLFNFIVKKNGLTYDNTFSFFFFVVGLGLFSSIFFNIKSLFLGVFMLLFLRKVYSLQNHTNGIKKLFDGGFWLGICFLFEPYIIVFIFLLYAAVYLYQKITFRELLVPIIGFVTPLFLYFTYCFWNEATEDFNNLFSVVFDFDFSILLESKFLIPILFLGIFSVISVFIKTPKVISVSNTFKFSWILLLVHLLIAFIFLFFYPNKSELEFQFLLFPTAIILGNGFEILKNKIVRDLIFIAFAILPFILFWL